MGISGGSGGLDTCLSSVATCTRLRMSSMLLANRSIGCIFPTAVSNGCSVSWYRPSGIRCYGFRGAVASGRTIWGDVWDEGVVKEPRNRRAGAGRAPFQQGVRGRRGRGPRTDSDSSTPTRFLPPHPPAGGFPALMRPGDRLQLPCLPLLLARTSSIEFSFGLSRVSGCIHHAEVRDLSALKGPAFR